MVSAIGMLGFIPFCPRISARWGHLFTFSLVWLAVDGLTRWSSSLHVGAYPEKLGYGLLVLQALSLLANRQQATYWPFTEWWKKPSEWWPTYSKLYPLIPKSTYNSQFPYFTGYIDEVVTPGYTGGFALQAQHDRYGITDPNGQRIR